MAPRFINVAPDWAAIMPLLIELLKNRRAETAQTAREEIMRCARLADEYRQKLKEEQAESAESEPALFFKSRRSSAG